MTNAPASQVDEQQRPRADGNAVDIHYLEEAGAALLPMMAATDAAASRGTTNDVRVLAHEALTVQTEQLEAISSCLLDWGRPGGVRPATTRSDGLADLHGHELDQAFADRLRTHARASIVASRTEMVDGASRRTRPIALDDISAQHHQLTALDRVFPPAGAEADRPA